MKARLTISFLCIFILWSSMVGSGNYASFSNSHEIKASSEIVFNALAPSEKYEAEKLTYFPSIILVNLAINRAYVLQDLLQISHSFTHRFSKFYLLFCVLRN